eukprot:8529564-Pyramimonas_sp.AAC.1
MYTLRAGGMQRPRGHSWLKLGGGVACPCIVLALGKGAPHPWPGCPSWARAPVFALGSPWGCGGP